MMDAAQTARAPSRALAAGLSLLVPGLGQWFLGRRARGVSLLLTVAAMLLMAWWAQQPAWFVLPAVVWAWNVWDAAAPGPARSTALPLLAAAALFYGLGWKATEINLGALTRNFDRAYRQILVPMTQPDFVERRSEVREAWVQLQVPCSDAPPTGTNSVNDMQLSLSVGCAKVGDQVSFTGIGFWPQVDAALVWQSPIGDFFPLRDKEGHSLTAPVDAQGSVAGTITVPSAIPPGIDPNLPQEQRLYLQQKRPVAGYELSTNGHFVVQGIYETLALALMATSLGTLLAVPISFLAARNLMSANPITLAIYVAVRTALNIVRSIESLIIAIVFVVIVGLGPFAGMLALTVHTVAALAKLYSEVIEGIDPGPIEAMRATGATWLQVVRYGVVPQIIPPFTAFTIYRWDINVRSSVIIGFVGGGGIGFFLVQWVNLSDFRAVSASFIAILLVVALMDQLSARIRARLI
jgi:phosphonate transport system permease protein